MRPWTVTLLVVASTTWAQGPPLGLREDVVATDHLGRTLTPAAETGPPRPEKQVGIFYFLWLGAHAQGGNGWVGPYDVTKILAADPEAMQKPDSPLWGPIHAPHHWGEPLFGYYRTDDPYVLRRHAQMLSDAGVDFVVFDVTNQITYREWYTALLETWSQVRAEGGRTPQVAFLCPFWQPDKVVRELWADLYESGLYPDLWYHLDGKPLILADPHLLGGMTGLSEHGYPTRLLPGQVLGQSFTAPQAFDSVAVATPTWNEQGSHATIRLRAGGPTGTVLAEATAQELFDNDWLTLANPNGWPAGEYTIELSEPTGTVGWWGVTRDALPDGTALLDGEPVEGDRTLRLTYVGGTGDPMRDFFTFRKPQPDYFVGPTGPDQWSWLEVYPQHVFHNAAGEREMMGVGVAQNAVDQRLGSMSEPDAKGRAWHNGAWDPDPAAVDLGLNFVEQAEHALAEDPRIVFVTGWNEWIAGRFTSFGGVDYPVMFVDQFDRAHSRDMEPMVGGHLDAFYYQLVDFVRRFKGVASAPPPAARRSLAPGAGAAAWAAVPPVVVDESHDEARRDHPGYGSQPAYVNNTGRNDLVAARVIHNAETVTFQVECREPITPSTDPTWMWLLLDVDGRRETGWEGYDFMLNRRLADPTITIVEAWQGPGFTWREVGQAPLYLDGASLAVELPRTLLGLTGDPFAVDFKWVDNPVVEGDLMAFLTNGDALPNGRFNYRYRGQ